MKDIRFGDKEVRSNKEVKNTKKSKLFKWFKKLYIFLNIAFNCEL